MHNEVKKFADVGDVKNLKYIFVDSLDVDPTFEEYLDDYNYCVKKGVFEPHENLTAFSDRQTDWNDNYWEKIKRDLLKNFSRERLDHMRKAAQVVNAEKVARLQKERQAAQQSAAPKIPQPTAPERPVIPPQSRTEFPTKSKAQQQQEEIEADRRKLAQENAQLEQQQRESERQQREKISNQKEKASPKKSSGVALWKIILAGAAGAAIIYNLLK